MTVRVPGQKNENLTDEDILQDMRIAAQACPRGELSVDRYNKIGRYHHRNAVRRFGSWNAALQRATPEAYARRHPTPEQMIADLHRVAEICRRHIAKQTEVSNRNKVRQMSKEFYDAHGKFAHTYIINHLAKEHLKLGFDWTGMKRAIGIADI